MRPRLLTAVFLACAASAAAFASNVVRVQAEGAAALPARVPGAAPAAAPSAAELKALRQRAIEAGIERAVLEHAGQLARESVRDDEAALRAALGEQLAALTLGHGVIAELGPREVVPRLPAGAPPPKPRRPTDPIPMEHAWRIEVLVDGDRVLDALRAAGLAFAGGGGADAAAVSISVAAPYDAPALAALRARLEALGASSVVPRRYRAEEVVLEVRGLDADVLARRLVSEPPAGYAAEAELDSSDPTALRVQLVANAASGVVSGRESSAARRASD